MNIYRKHEKGQIVIMLALAIVVLLGFAALAIDVGVIYSDRRYAQNAADAAALAGAQAALNVLEDPTHKGTGSWDPILWEDVIANPSAAAPAIDAARLAAKSRGADNSYTLSWLTTDPSYAEKHKIEVAVPASGGYRYLETQVWVSSRPSTSFVHLFFGGEIINSVEGVARVILRTTYGVGNGIFATENDPTCDDNSIKELVVGGTGSGSEVSVENGGIHSNSCTGFNGNVVVSADGGIHYVYATSPYPYSVTPPPSPAPSLQIPIDIPINCSGATERGYYNDPGGGETRTLLPGFYRGTNSKDAINISNGSSVITLNPGLYCIEKDISITNGKVTGNGVTIYLINGGLTISAGAEVDLIAPMDDYNQYKGLLIYSQPGNQSNITLIGNADSSFAGSVILPGDPTCAENECIISVNGTSGQVTPDKYNTSLIGYNVRAGGDGNINIRYDASSNYQLPASANMYR